MPVSALYFEYYYFETNKLVYEVGETINMIAKVTADFSNEGWCYTSFEVVTDFGPKFANGTFISPSPDVRYFTSSYTILPEDTSPGITGAQAFVIFNIEVYDTSSQGSGETIEVQLIRGRLQVIPTQSLTFEYGLNETLAFQVTSIHTQEIAYSNKPLSFMVQDSQTNTILCNNITTDSTGSFNLSWTPSIGEPGIYNLTVVTPSSDTFQSLTQFFPVIVEPSASNLTIITAPESVYCEDPESSHNDTIHLVIKHTTLDDNAIESSTISCQTSFLGANLTSLGNGLYDIYIPFTRAPGTELVNLTSYNPLYQAATRTVQISVIQREVVFDVSINPDAVCGTILSINVTTADQLSGIIISAIPLSLQITVNDTIIDTVTGITDLTGQFSCSIYLFQTTWGLGEVSVQTNDTTYYESKQENHTIEVFYEPWVESQVVQDLILGEETMVFFKIFNPLNITISDVPVTLYNPLNNLIGTSTTDSGGYAMFNWTVSDDISAGFHEYIILLNESRLQYISTISLDFNFFVHLPLRIHVENPVSTVVRGNNATIRFTLDSEYQPNSLVEIKINDDLAELVYTAVVLTDHSVEINLSTAHNNSLGFHNLSLQCTNGTVIILGTFNLDLFLFGTMSIDLETNNAFYDESLEFQLTGVSDNNETIDLFSFNVYLKDTGTLIASLENITSESVHLVPLPLWLLPGFHDIIFNMSCPWYLTFTEIISIIVWMRTNIVISLYVGESAQSGGTLNSPTSDSLQISDSTPIISSGSIISPPPILLSDTTSTPDSTALETSLESCPRFSSGTSNLSTVLAKSLISASGNGQIVLKRSALSDFEWCGLVIISSTVLDVHPNETIPQSALLGPVITVSVKRVELLATFADILRTKSLWT